MELSEKLFELLNLVNEKDINLEDVNCIFDISEMYNQSLELEQENRILKEVLTLDENT